MINTGTVPEGDIPRGDALHIVLMDNDPTVDHGSVCY